MRVATGTSHRETEPDRAGRFDAVEGVFGFVFVLDGAALARAHVATDVTGTDFLLDRSGGQKVARQLFDGELVERHIVVKRFDHPIAELPDGTRIVGGIAARIGVTSQIEPDVRPALTVRG